MSCHKSGNKNPIPMSCGDRETCDEVEAPQRQKGKQSHSSQDGLMPLGTAAATERLAGGPRRSGGSGSGSIETISYRAHASSVNLRTDDSVSHRPRAAMTGNLASYPRSSQGSCAGSQAIPSISAYFKDSRDVTEKQSKNAIDCPLASTNFDEAACCANTNYRGMCRLWQVPELSNDSSGSKTEIHHKEEQRMRELGLPADPEMARPRAAHGECRLSGKLEAAGAYPGTSTHASNLRGQSNPAFLSPMGYSMNCVESTGTLPGSLDQSEYAHSASWDGLFLPAGLAAATRTSEPANYFNEADRTSARIPANGAADSTEGLDGRQCLQDLHNPQLEAIMYRLIMTGQQNLQNQPLDLQYHARHTWTAFDNSDGEQNLAPLCGFGGPMMTARNTSPALKDAMSQPFHPLLTGVNTEMDASNFLASFVGDPLANQSFSATLAFCQLVQAAAYSGHTRNVAAVPDFCSSYTNYSTSSSRDTIRNGNPEPLTNDPAPVPTPTSLASDDDQNWLSEYMRFIRQEMVEVFEEKKEYEVHNRANGRKIGFRCRFCAHLPLRMRAKRSFTFPSSLSKLYHNLGAMFSVHFQDCKAIPDNIIRKYLALKEESSQGAMKSKDYWVDSAIKQGFVDTPHGIYFDGKSCGEASDEARTGDTISEFLAVPLVTPGDQILVYGYLYLVMVQGQRVVMTDFDGRDNPSPNIPGFACRFCCRHGRQGLCRFFPTSRHELPEKIDRLYDHLQRCNICPTETKYYLERSRYERIFRERNAIVKEREDMFFDLVWNRLQQGIGAV